MNIGVYFDLRNPPERRVDASALYGFTLELCEEAERLGAHSVWLSEHHRFDDDYLPQPLTLAAAIAARTSRVRIGTALVLAPLRPAAQLAEEAAVVDLISGGRLDLGLGAGYRRPEFALFGADFTTRFTTLDRRVGELQELWRTRGVTPTPVQDPFPLWLGYLSEKGARRAGRMGVGLLSADPELRAPYLEGLDEGGHGRDAGRMAGPINGFITEDPERDWPTVARHLAYHQDSYNAHALEGTDAPPARPTDPDRLRAKGLARTGKGFLLATPAEAAAALRERYAGTGVETVYLFASLGGLPFERVAEHVRAICSIGPLIADVV